MRTLKILNYGFSSQHSFLFLTAYCELNRRSWLTKSADDELFFASLLTCVLGEISIVYGPGLHYWLILKPR